MIRLKFCYERTDGRTDEQGDSRSRIYIYIIFSESQTWVVAFITKGFILFLRQHSSDSCKKTNESHSNANHFEDWCTKIKNEKVKVCLEQELLLVKT